MTGLVDPVVGAPRDPFELTPGAPAPTRPRLLSYCGRWGRARRWLPPTALRILDVGCAFGYGSAAIGAHGPAGRVVVGVERDPEHLAMARRLYPWVTILDADAGELPVPDGCADAVLMLDVIEHIADAERVLAGLHRVLRPGGLVVVSVPHRGPQSWLDALNIYAGIRRRWPSLPPLESATDSDGGPHRHFSAQELTELLSPWFTVDRVARTGLGFQELFALGLTAIHVGLRAPGLVRALQPLHMLVYIVDDLVPSGRFGYHLTVRATVRPSEVA
jgi:SAM-dependent methyltransferase